MVTSQLRPFLRTETVWLTKIWFLALVLPGFSSCNFILQKSLKRVLSVIVLEQLYFWLDQQCAALKRLQKVNIYCVIGAAVFGVTLPRSEWETQVQGLLYIQLSLLSQCLTASVMVMLSLPIWTCVRAIFVSWPGAIPRRTWEVMWSSVSHQPRGWCVHSCW